MTERTQKKKIYQLAKELNISHETLIDYLKKRGHQVLSHMTLVTEEMMPDVNAHFKKDKEQAEKHQRKLQTIRESQQKLDSKEEKKAAAEKEKKSSRSSRKKVTDEKPAVVEATTVPETETLEVVQSPDIVPEIEPLHQPPVEVQEEKDEVQVSITAETGAPPVAETTVVESLVPAEPAPEKTEIVETATPSPTVEPEKDKSQDETKAVTKPAGPQKPEVLRMSPPKLRGLKIMGKTELVDPSRTESSSEGGDKKSDDSALKKKKKKKKRVKVDREKVVTGVAEKEDAGSKAKKKKKGKPNEVDQGEVAEAIRRTLADIGEGAAGLERRAAMKKKRKEKREAEEQERLVLEEKEKSILRLTEYVTVNELATIMNATASEVIMKCMTLGLMVSINHRLDKDTILLVADEFGFQVQFISEMAEEIFDEPDPEEKLSPRPPVVTIMGHVDHGKTSLLDYIRQTNIVAGESGGITQHIGAYSVRLDSGKQITFLDTPGHEAFTAMRARGAQITDIVILVVAADDSVMPQTIEAISHAQAANVPIVVAINKCDKPEANPDKIKQQLSERNVLIEEWGGRYQCVELSARTGKNVDLLLEKILLESDVLNLKANPDRLARGVVIEARVDKGKGTVATVLVQKGTLKVGSSFVAGIQSGKVRAMLDERDRRVEVVGPSAPIQMLGFDGVPNAGDSFVVVEDDRMAREISLKRTQLKREQDFRLIRSLTLDNLSQKISEGKIKELKVVVKGDVDGSVGALADSLMKIAHAEVRVNVIHRAVGAISESDVLLAAASGAVIIGFHVRPTTNARKIAEQEQVDIRLYNIIYDAINDVKKALEGLLSPEKKEEITATVNVQDVIKIPKVGNIAGCRVVDGKIVRSNRVRIIRDGIVVYEGTLSSLKRFKDDVREVESGFECGIGIENFNDIKVGDVIEAYKVVELMRKLV